MTKLSTSKKRFQLFRQTKHQPDADPHATDQMTKPAPKKRWTYLTEYGVWLGEHRRSLITIFGNAIVAIGLDMAGPLITVYIINHIWLGTTMDTAERIHLSLLCCGLLAFLHFATSGLNLRRNILVSRLNAKLVFRLRHRLFDRFLRLPVTELSELKTGGIITRLSNDVDSTTGLVQLGLISPTLSTLRVIVAFCLMLTLSWKIALATMAMMLPIVWFHSKFVRRIRPIYRSMSRDRSEIDGRVSESFNGIRVVRGFGRESKEQLEYAVGHHTVSRKQLWAHLLQNTVGLVWELMLPMSHVIIILIGGYLVIQGEILVGIVLGCQTYLWKLIEPLMHIAHSITETQRGLAAMERVFDILDRPQEKPDPPDAVDAPHVVRELEFSNVSFAYRPDLTVIHDFNLKIRGGSVVALVGPSGAGKTTITDLVARFHDPSAGAINLNGVDLRKIRLREFRQLLGVVQQDVFLFDGTVSENIGYGRREATRAQIIDAAQRANAEEFILKLPEGYDTLVGERGVKLSGGQRQRLSIARAILANPQILILDEATSNLDTESEQLIQASMKELLANRTTFVIAHRLSTVTNADCIVVLDRGRIEEVGTHGQLMAKQGMYYDMVQRQQHRDADAAGRSVAWELEKNSA